MGGHLASPQQVQQPHLCHHEDGWGHLPGPRLQCPQQPVLCRQLLHEGHQRVHHRNQLFWQHSLLHCEPHRLLANYPASSSQAIHSFHHSNYGPIPMGHKSYGFTQMPGQLPICNGNCGQLQLQCYCLHQQPPGAHHHPWNHLKTMAKWCNV